MRTSVAIRAVTRIPPPRAKEITCEICGWSTPRWRRRIHADDAPVTGMLDMVAHELQVHTERAE